jgi:hypothetical protein
MMMDKLMEMQEEKGGGEVDKCCQMLCDACEKSGIDPKEALMKFMMGKDGESESEDMEEEGEEQSESEGSVKPNVKLIIASLRAKKAKNA